MYMETANKFPGTGKTPLKTKSWTPIFCPGHSPDPLQEGVAIADGKATRRQDEKDGQQSQDHTGHLLEGKELPSMGAGDGEKAEPDLCRGFAGWRPACGTDCCDADRNAAPAVEAPRSNLLPRLSAKLPGLESTPFARRNLDPMRETVSSHASGLIENVDTQEGRGVINGCPGLLQVFQVFPISISPEKEYSRSQSVIRLG